METHVFLHPLLTLIRKALPAISILKTLMNMSCSSFQDRGWRRTTREKSGCPLVIIGKINVEGHFRRCMRVNSKEKQNLSRKSVRPTGHIGLTIITLGSDCDLLLFSNDENHSAVSLHLLEIERQVTPLMWLNVWLDNVMASLPELAVYHRKLIVQGYELLKTNDIFLVKGLAEDGSAFFHPHVFQKTASTVLRFLQDNCKQDPGTYWVLKNAGEDLMQLFDLIALILRRRLP